MPPRSTKLDPKIIEMPSRKMAVVRTKGDPNTAGEQALSALYGSVYTLKFALKKQGQDFKVEALRARWPDAHLLPKEEWTGIWGLPVPEDTESLPQKNPAVTVSLETWDYGMVAQILHLGPFSEEGPTVQRLHGFIEENGYALTGSHEEEYLTRIDAKQQKTIIRQPVRRRDS